MSHMDLEKMSIQRINGTTTGDILCALWYLFVFSSLRGSSCSIKMERGKVVEVELDGVKLEPTFSGINKAIRLGRCRDGEK